MAELTSVERMTRVLRREEPDRVPHFEWSVDKVVRQAILPGCKTHNEFAVAMGHDAVMVDADFAKKQVGPDRWWNEWGYVAQYNMEEHGIEVESPIQTMSDLEKYKPPDPHAPGRYASIERTLREFDGKKAVIVHLNDVFSIPRSLMSMETLLMAIAAEPEFVKAIVDMSIDVNLEMAKEIAARGAKFVWTGDDYAYTNGPLMSPQSFREIFCPGLHRVMHGYKELGFFILKHTDGNLWPILDMIVDSGIDCLDPLDPVAGMDIAEVKEKYGHRIAVKGNVDCAQTLTFGSVEEVVAETKEALRKGMPGGGYILSSSNSIHSSVKPDNYLAMLKTLKEFGNYPMSM